jgi:excisionase family DNA binding protein
MIATHLTAIALDRDVAGHLAVAIHRHRAALAQNGLAEPAALADLETVALQVLRSTQEHSGALTVEGGVHDDLSDREFLTRRDVQHLTAASAATVDRWIASHQLPSRKQGRLRRISRHDLNEFLSTGQRMAEDRDA